MQDNRSAELLKMIERMDLDRQILFREKVQVLLEDEKDLEESSIKVTSNESMID